MLLFIGPTVFLPLAARDPLRKICQGARFTEPVAYEALLEAFSARFGDLPEVIVSAPARVNLIGEHTDYSGGWVFPVAIDLEMAIAAGRSVQLSTVASRELGDAEPFSTATLSSTSPKGWARYVAGVAWALQRKTKKAISEIKALVASDIPIGTGISSSAALEVCLGMVWDELDQLCLSQREVALASQSAENDFVGMKCGIMDQMASACGRAGHAMLLDTKTLDIEFVPLPNELAIVLCDTNKPHSHEESGYNDRRAECDAALRALGWHDFREASLQDLEGSRKALSEVLYSRAKHIVTENHRCRAFAQALKALDLNRVGSLMNESHLSMQHDYEVSCTELDLMAESAWISPGCVGARMTGGGFGGACVALVRESEVEPFIHSASELYRSKSGLEPQFRRCKSAEGAHIVPAETWAI